MGACFRRLIIVWVLSAWMTTWAAPAWVHAAPSLARPDAPAPLTPGPTRYLAQDEATEASVEGRGRSWSPVLLSSLSLAGGLALAIGLKNAADDRYDDYLTTADPDAARESFEAAERLDRWSLVGWLVAQASFVWLFFSIIQEGERPLIPTQGPLIAPTSDGGVTVGFRVTP